MTEEIDKFTGLTPQEELCHAHLMGSYESFLRLPVMHPDERRTYVEAVHTIQGLFALRIAAREYPDLWQPSIEVQDKTPEDEIENIDWYRQATAFSKQNLGLTK